MRDYMQILWVEARKSYGTPFSIGWSALYIVASACLPRLIAQESHLNGVSFVWFEGACIAWFVSLIGLIEVYASIRAANLMAIYIERGAIRNSWLIRGFVTLFAAVPCVFASVIASAFTGAIHTPSLFVLLVFGLELCILSAILGQLIFICLYPLTEVSHDLASITMIALFIASYVIAIAVGVICEIYLDATTLYPFAAVLVILGLSCVIAFCCCWAAAVRAPRRMAAFVNTTSSDLGLRVSETANGPY